MIYMATRFSNNNMQSILKIFQEFVKNLLKDNSGCCRYFWLRWNQLGTDDRYIRSFKNPHRKTFGGIWWIELASYPLDLIFQAFLKSENCIWKRMDVACNVRIGSVRLENSNPEESLSFWPNKIVKHLITVNSQDCFVINVICLYSIIGTHSTPHCHILQCSSCFWMSIEFWFASNLSVLRAGRSRDVKGTLVREIDPT